MTENFLNIYNQGFVRCAVAIPPCKVADVPYNVSETIKLIKQADDQHVALVVFPEMGITGYSLDDLLGQKVLLDSALSGLASIVNYTSSHTNEKQIVIVGMPLVVDSTLFNVAVIIDGGNIVGVIPKTYLPNYREFYEARQFAPGTSSTRQTISLLGFYDIPFGTNIIFRTKIYTDDQNANPNSFSFFVEICEDIFAISPPSSYAAMAGANILVNLSASNALVAKNEYRHSLVQNQSARCLAAYLYTSAGVGESTNDVVFDGAGMIYENGTLLGESKRFSLESQLITADIDLDRLDSERRRQTSFAECIRNHKQIVSQFRYTDCESGPCVNPEESIPLQRNIPKFPFVPGDPKTMDSRCEEIYNIQVHALIKRIKHSGLDKLVLGVSGGLDSTQALIVACSALDKLNLPRKNLLAYTLPAFGTSNLTKNNAIELMKAVGCSYETVDMKPSCMQMIKDIKHPYAEGNPVYDITFENIQAGQRTSYLFRVANQNKAIVVGTGDLSEIALGWSTYGVGDHMSHYNVNCGVPKTLIKHLVEWTAHKNLLGELASHVLLDIANTKISPELIPSDTDSPKQESESVVGPYELQDFFMYYIVRFGYTPGKIAFLANHAWKEKYSPADIKKWLGVFCYRFFQISQFKRTCVPAGPKVGSVSLSPRGDWRMPSDAEAKVWMLAVDRIPA